MCATLATAVGAALLLGPDHPVLAVAVTAALVWSCAPLATALLGQHVDGRQGNGQAGGQGALADDEPPVDAELPSVTTIVRLGDEPIEIVRATLALAHRSGPTMLATTGQGELGELSAEADGVHHADTMEAAVRAAARAATTDAVLVVSGRALPRTPACRRAARLLDEHTGWVCGTAWLAARICAKGTAVAPAWPAPDTATP